MSDKKKVLLVVNPCSGRNKTRRSPEEIMDKFSDDEYEFDVHNTKCQGDATNIVKEELDDNDMVICCGGDGTLNETINGVMDMPRRKPIGYIPAGSTNDLATTLGIPMDLDKAAELIKDGRINEYDIGLFNNRYFSYVASFGAFTRSSYATNQKLKNIFGYAAYIPTAVPDAFNIKKYRMRIEYDGGVIEDEFVFGSISNSTSVAGFFKFNTDDVKLNDGVFEVLLCKTIKFSSVIPMLYKVRHQQYDGKQLIFLRTTKLKVTSLDCDVDWTLDGEYGGAHKDVMVHVLERAIRVYSEESSLFLPTVQPSEASEDEQEASEKQTKKKKLFKKEKKAATAITEADSAEADETVSEEVTVSE